jgi:hypothetical protein
MNFAFFRRKFDEILPKKENFAGISQQWSGNDKMSRDLEKKFQKIRKMTKSRKFVKFLELVRNFILHCIISIHSLVDSCSAAPRSRSVVLSASIDSRRVQRVFWTGSRVAICAPSVVNHGGKCSNVSFVQFCWLRSSGTQ